MTNSNKEIEDRINKAIDVLNTRKNVKRIQVAREFNVSVERLRSRLKEKFSLSFVRELHNRALKSDQKLVLHIYLTKLNEINLSTRLHMMKRAANVIRLQDATFINSLSSLSRN